MCLVAAAMRSTEFTLFRVLDHCDMLSCTVDGLGPCQVFVNACAVSAHIEYKTMPYAKTKMSSVSFKQRLLAVLVACCWGEWSTSILSSLSQAPGYTTHSSSATQFVEPMFTAAPLVKIPKHCNFPIPRELCVAPKH